jgi:hypothetical protein
MKIVVGQVVAAKQALGASMGRFGRSSRSAPIAWTWTGIPASGGLSAACRPSLI